MYHIVTSQTQTHGAKIIQAIYTKFKYDLDIEVGSIACDLTWWGYIKFVSNYYGISLHSTQL